MVGRKLNKEDNNLLLTPFTIYEFKKAVFEMHPDKALGPDCLNPAFYRMLWDMCGEDIYQVCTRWLNEGTIPSSLGDTNIVLVPNCVMPISMRDLRPISLCSVVYTILAKTLANRLQRVLSKCIFEEQSGFVSGRSVLDNVSVVSEIIHHLKCKTGGRKG